MPPSACGAQQHQPPTAARPAAARPACNMPRPAAPTAPRRAAPRCAAPCRAARQALKAEGYRVILVNSNPATIMTDPGTADRTYVGPMTPELVEQIIAKVGEGLE